ncbi:hypothetical protein GCM10023206_06290 [Acinetobacter puyangensis]|uniref:Uncharacterized protein n=1 Tax=Acinetobacter puyangensis TaxID=1096779 RepID=A0A240EAN6_9GAMM|nr:hypothetical protein [Acinetobacter puyangensis]SNX45788.1 hypothetical protein SAMN05421731_10623 [Acinetobacter puyangensis]
MQKTLILSFIVFSISYGCSNKSSQNATLADESSVELKNIAPELQAWAGEYSGAIPYVPCFPFCPDCKARGVRLT